MKFQFDGVKILVNKTKLQIEKVNQIIRFEKTSCNDKNNKMDFSNNYFNLIKMRCKWSIIVFRIIQMLIVVHWNVDLFFCIAHNEIWHLKCHTLFALFWSIRDYSWLMVWNYYSIPIIHFIRLILNFNA